MSTRLGSFTTDKYAIEDAGKALDAISAESRVPSTLSQDKATLLQERKEQKQVDLGLFNSSRSATPKEGYVDVNRSALEGTIIPGVSTGYYPKELVDQYQQPQQVQEVPTTGMSVEEFKQQRTKEKYEDLGVLGRAVNAVKGAGYYFGSGVQDTADAVVEGAGKVVAEGVKAAGFEDLGKKIDAWDPIGTEEEKSERLKELTGFNSYGVDQAMERAKGYISESLKGVEATDPSTWGKATAGGFLKALGEVATQPELALSLLYIAGPNMVVGGGTKLASLTAAKLAKDSQALNNVIKVVNTPVAQESMKVAALGGAINNNDLDSLQATLGKDAEGNPNQVTMERALLGWAMSSAAASLDKMAYDKIVGGIGTKPLKEVFKDLGENKARALVGTLVYGAGVAAKAGMLEAPQEFVQSYVEAFNGAYGGKNKDGSTITAKQALNDGLTEAVLGGMAGLAAGTYASAGMQGGRAAVDSIRAAQEQVPVDPTTPVTQESAKVEAPVDVAAKKQEYVAKWNSLADDAEALNPTNAITYVNRINELEALGEFLGDTEKANYAKNYVAEFKTKVTEMLPNKEFKLGSVEEVTDVVDFVLSHEGNYSKPELQLGSESSTEVGELLPTVKEGLEQFAARNGLSQEVLADKISQYEIVGKDASEGSRGYLTYGRMLKGLTSSDTPDVEAINSVKSKLLGYQQSQIRAIGAITKALEVAESGSENNFELEGYRKKDGSPFNVLLDTEKRRQASIKTLRNMLVEKEKNLQGIEKVVNGYSGSVKEVVPEQIDNEVPEQVKEVPTEEITFEYDTPVQVVQPVDRLLGRWAEAQKVDGGLVVTADKENAVEALLQEVELEGYKAKGVFNKDMVYAGTNSVVATIEIGKNTVLNTLPVSGMTGVVGTVRDTAVGSIKATIAPYSTDNRSATMGDSPARGLIYGKDGKVNEAVVTALQLAVQEAVYTTKDMLKSKVKTVEELSAMLSVPEFEVTPEMQMALNKGMLYKTLADAVGKSTAKMLGVSKAKDVDVDNDSYERLIADLGSTGILMGVQQGLLKTEVMSSAEYSSLMAEVTDYADNEYTDDAKGPTVRFVTLGAVDRVASSDTTFKQVLEVLPEANTRLTGPMLRAPSDKYLESKEIKVRKGLIEGVAVPTEAQEAIKKLDKMRWTVDLEGVKYIQGLLKNDELGFKQLLGYIEIGSPAYNDMVWDDKQVQEAKNDAVDKSIEVLKQLLVEHADKSELDVWFNWEYIRNGRLMLDSNTLNPQTDKQLHRFLVSPADHYTSYKVEKDADGRFRFIAVADGSNGLGADKDVTVNMYYAIAQALGFAVDKASTKEVINFAAGVLNMGAVEVAGMKNSLLRGENYEFTVNGSKYKAKVEHVGHMLQAIRMLEDYHEGKDVRTSLSAEFDDVTSGFAIKSLQYPILENMEEHLKRVGVRMDGTGSSMNDVLASGEVLDSYQAIGANFLTVPKADREYLKKVKWDSRFNGLGKAVMDMMPTAKVVDGKVVVGEDLRKIFKPVFMVFNYAAGMKGIRGAMTNDIKTRMVKKLVAIDPAKWDSVKGTPEGRLLAAIGTTFGAKGVNSVLERLKKEPLSKIRVNGVSLDKVITDVVQATYGEEVERVLSEGFAPYFVLQESMNNVFKAAFVVYQHKLEKSKEAWRKANKGALTKEVEMEIAMGLVDEVFPAIKGPLASSLREGLVVAAETKIAGKSQVQTHVSKDLLGQSTVTVRPVLKKLAPAVKAGSAISIQQLDGAKLVKVINGLTGKGRYEGRTVGVTYIHDAVIPPLWYADEVVKKSNEMTLQLGKEYSVMKEVEKLANSIMVASTDSDVVEALDKVTMKKTSEGAVTFAQGLQGLSESVSNMGRVVEEARSNVLDKVVAVGNSVGTSNMVYGGSEQVVEVPAVTKTQEAGTITLIKELNNLSCNKG